MIRHSVLACLVFAFYIYSVPLRDEYGKDLTLKMRSINAPFGQRDLSFDVSKYADLWAGKVKSGPGLNDYRWIAVMGGEKDMGVSIFDLHLNEPLKKPEYILTYINKDSFPGPQWPFGYPSDFNDAKVIGVEQFNGNAYGFFASTGGFGLYVVQLTGFSGDVYRIDTQTIDHIFVKDDVFPSSPCGGADSCPQTGQVHNCYVYGKYVYMYTTGSNNAIYIWQWRTDNAIDVRYRATITTPFDGVHDISIKRRPRDNKLILVAFTISDNYWKVRTKSADKFVQINDINANGWWDPGIDEIFHYLQWDPRCGNTDFSRDYSCWSNNSSDPGQCDSIDCLPAQELPDVPTRFEDFDSSVHLLSPLDTAEDPYLADLRHNINGRPVSYGPTTGHNHDLFRDHFVVYDISSIDTVDFHPNIMLVKRARAYHSGSLFYSDTGTNDYLYTASEMPSGPVECWKLKSSSDGSTYDSAEIVHIIEPSNGSDEYGQLLWDYDSTCYDTSDYGNPFKKGFPRLPSSCKRTSLGFDPICIDGDAGCFEGTWGKWNWRPKSFTRSHWVTAHHPLVFGDKLFISWYWEGAVVLDIGNPENSGTTDGSYPFTRFYSRDYDANPKPCVMQEPGSGDWHGCWRVFPIDDTFPTYTQAVLMSDMEKGLFVLDLAPKHFEDYTKYSKINQDTFGTITASTGNFIRKDDTVTSNIYLCNTSNSDNGKQVDVLYEKRGDYLYKKDIAFKSASGGMRYEESGASQGVVFDYNQDGWMDLFVGNYKNVASPSNPYNFLYTNIGDTNKDGLSEGFRHQLFDAERSALTFGAVSWDIEPDGVEELVEINLNRSLHSSIAGEMRVYGNQYLTNPSYPFYDITASVIDTATNDIGYAVRIKETDGDGVAELWSLQPGVLKKYVKTSGKYTFLQTGFSGSNYDSINSFPAGTAFAFDFGYLDGDTAVDLFTGGRIYLNNGNGSFSERTSAQTGLSSLDSLTIRGACFFSYTVDDYQDLYVTTTNGYQILFRNDSSTNNVHFSIAEIFMGEDSPGAIASGAALFDFDRDKKVDILQCFSSGNHCNKLYRNLAFGTYHYTFALRGGFPVYGPGYSNRNGIGGKISLYAAGHAGESNQIVSCRDIENGQSGNISMDRSKAEFVFPDNTTYDVVATFPSGRKKILYNTGPGFYLIEEPFDENIISRSIGMKTAPLFDTGTVSTNTQRNQAVFSCPVPLNVGLGDRVILSPGGADQETVYVYLCPTSTRIVFQQTAQHSHSGASFRIERAYNTLQAWENDRGGDLVARGTIEKGICYNDSDFTSGVNISGNTTDRNHYLWLTTAPNQRHHGKPGTGARVNVSSGGAIDAYSDYTRIEWLEITGGTTGSLVILGHWGEGDSSVLSNCLIYGSRAGYSGAVDISGNGVTTGIRVENCMIWDATRAGIATWTANSTCEVINCTVFKCNQDNDVYRGGITKGFGAMTVKNCISMGNGVTDFSGGPAMSYCLSSDSSADGTGSLKGRNTFGQFVDTTLASVDLHLKPGSIAINTGDSTGLSGILTRDIDDTVRHYDKWDMGADEFYIVPPDTISRSIGNTAAVLFSGSGNASLNSEKDVVTLSSGSFPGNIGEGDSVRIGSPSQTGFISARLNGTQIRLQEPLENSETNSNVVVYRAYNTLQAWEDASPANLVSEGVIWKGVCYDDGHFTSGIEIRGSTSDRTHYKLLAVASEERHTGKAGTGVTVAVDSGNTAVLMRENFCVVDGLELSGGSVQAVVGQWSDGDSMTLRNCLAYGSKEPYSGAILTSAATACYGNRVENCVVYGAKRAGMALWNGGTVEFYNNTVFGCNTDNDVWRAGIQCETGALTVKNCISMNNGIRDFRVRETQAMVQAYNISSDTTASNTGSLQGKTLNEIKFVSTQAGSEDFHIQAGSVAIDTGTNLSAVFTKDVDGGIRPVPWDIGADEFNVSAKKRMSDQAVDLPKVFALRQNMPNPFNPVTVIKYEIPFKSGVNNLYNTRLDIYDVRGKLVRNLINEVKSPGYYSIVWNGRADNGRALASGLYVYRFTSGRFSKQMKMILIK